MKAVKNETESTNGRETAVGAEFAELRRKPSGHVNLENNAGVYPVMIAAR